MKSSLPSCLPSDPPNTKSSVPIKVAEWPTSAGGGVPETVGTFHSPVSSSKTRTSCSGFSLVAPPSSTSFVPTVESVGEMRGFGRAPLTLRLRQFIVTRTCTSLRHCLPSWPPKMYGLRDWSACDSTSVDEWPKRGIGGSPPTRGTYHVSVSVSRMCRSLPPPTPPKTTMLLPTAVAEWRARGEGSVPCTTGFSHVIVPT